MLVRESINFERTGNVKKSLGIGYEAVIRKFFRDLQIADNFYIIKDNGEVVYNTDLYLVGTKITELPDNLTVNGTLILKNTNITKLPDNLKLNDGLYLSNSNLTNLPDNLIVNGTLNLENTNITELPDNLTVNRYLDLRNNNITELPDDLKVGKSIYINSHQTELIHFIENSKFRNQLDIW